MITYEAFYLPDLEEGIYLPYAYNDEQLIFHNGNIQYDVDEVLYDSNWTIDKCIDNDRLKIKKKLFVEELNLPYVELDIEALPNKK